MNGFMFVPAFGVLVKDMEDTKESVKHETVFFTTDTQFCPNQLIDFYKMADLIIQDSETSFKSGVHAHFNELCTLPEDIKKKMILVHYQDNILDSVPEINSILYTINYKVSDEWQTKAKEAGFIGFAEKGHTITVN